MVPVRLLIHGGATGSRGVLFLAQQERQSRNRCVSLPTRGMVVSEKIRAASEILVSPGTAKGSAMSHDQGNRVASETALFDFRRPESQLLADLSCARSDFTRAMRAIRPLCLGPSFENLDVDVTEIRWAAAVVTYARPFLSGCVSWGAKERLDGLSQEQRVAHRRVMDIRSGYLAHSVGQMEDFAPVAQIETFVDGTASLVAVSCAEHRVVGPSAGDAARFLSLCESHLEWLEPRIREEKAKLLALAESIGVEEIKAAGPWEGRATSRSPKAPRPRFKAPPPR